MASLLAIPLSLGVTVFLLVAQFTAERHTRALYVEFRQERGWVVILALLAVGVLGIIGASLVATTLSTAWAALLLAVGLALLAASLFPSLLSSLDQTELAQRMTDRTVRRLTRIGKTATPRQLDPELTPVADRGIEIAGALTTEAIDNNDAEAVASGFAATRRILLAYLRARPFMDMSDPVVYRTFQHVNVAVSACAERSPVLLLPRALTELTALAVEAPTVPNPLNDFEPINHQTNSTFFDVVARTIVADDSAAAAMATAGIGDGGVALVQRGRSTGSSDHIGKLRAIALGGIQAHRNHIVGQANHELARIALALSSQEGGVEAVMPASLYEDAAEAFSEVVTAFIKAPTIGGRLNADLAMTPVTGPLASPNLASVIVAGLAAHQRGRPRHARSRFTTGAGIFAGALIRLGKQSPEGVMTVPYARDTLYSAVIGALTIPVTDDVARQVASWWSQLCEWLIDPKVETEFGSEHVLAALLLFGVYQAEASGTPMAGPMRSAVDKVITEFADRPDEVRRRFIRAWSPAARAAIATGDDALANRIVDAIRADILVQRRDMWEPLDDQELFLQPLAFGTPYPVLPTLHESDEAQARFEELLGD